MEGAGLHQVSQQSGAERQRSSRPRHAVVVRMSWMSRQFDFEMLKYRDTRMTEYALPGGEEWIDEASRSRCGRRQPRGGPASG